MWRMRDIHRSYNASFPLITLYQIISGQTDSSDFSRDIPIWFIASRAVIIFVIMLCGVIGNGLVIVFVIMLGGVIHVDRFN